MHSTIAGEDRRPDSLQHHTPHTTQHTTQYYYSLLSLASSEPIFSFYFIFACNCVSNKNPIMSTPLYIYLLMGEYGGQEG